VSIALTTGIFSGLDIEQVIGQLMTIEKRPLVQLQNKKASYEVKISSFGSISSSLTTLGGAVSSLKDDSIYSIKATSSDTSVFTASASSGASEGKYNIVVDRLASKQSVYSAAFSSETDEVADLSVVGTQTLKIQVGGSAIFNITVDSSNNTLTGIRDAINGADAGVRASVINDGTGYRLVLSTDSTGEASRLVLQVDEDGDGLFENTAGETDTAGLSRLAFNPESYDADTGDVIVGAGVANMTQSQAALDASLEIDGLAVTRSSNTINDAITGVTINLLSAKPGSTITLDVSKDLAQIESNVSSFVEQYNASMGLLRSLVVPVGSEGMVLTGDGTARSIISTLRSVVTRSFSDYTPADLGLSHDKLGTLSLDSSKLNSAIEGDLEGVLATFDSMAEYLEDAMDSFIKTMIPARKDGLQRTVDLIDNRIESAERRIDRVELMYRKKFAALEQTMAELQQSSDYLSRQLDSLSSITQYSKKA
jgi:flagellar hook-associated protein 2